jgi:hypothetical protein
MACRVIPAAALPLTASPLAPEQVIAGDPQVGVAALVTDPVEIGVWEHTAGVSSDTEADELFVVLSGRARIEVADGTVLEVGPGDVGILEAGAETVWTVSETLRKIYVLLPSSR